jgi:MFS family permease
VEALWPACSPWPVAAGGTPSRPASPKPDEGASGLRDRARPGQPPAALVLSALTFAAVETGIESGAGIWGYAFLTAGRGLSHETAGVIISAYWTMMSAGRVVLGPVAERLGPARVLAAAVVGVPLGALSRWLTYDH